MFLDLYSCRHGSNICHSPALRAGRADRHFSRGLRIVLSSGNSKHFPRIHLQLALLFIGPVYFLQRCRQFHLDALIGAL